MKISRKIKQYQLESQTWPLQNAPVYIKVLAFIYQLIGRKIIAKSMVCSSRCNSCNHCVNVCPNKAIKFRLRNPRRNNKCKGCLLCVYTCPMKSFELPVSSLIGAFLLIFLPYDKWIIKLFSLDIVPNMMSMKYQFFSLILWCIGYTVLVYIFEKVIFLFSTFSFFKKLGEIPAINKARNKIHPALIFPVIISVSTRNMHNKK